MTNTVGEEAACSIIVPVLLAPISIPMTNLGLELAIVLECRKLKD